MDTGEKKKMSVHYFRKAYEAQTHGDLGEAIDLDPDFGNPYNDIGAYFIELGKFDDAIPFLEKATKASRYDTYCFPHYNLGRVWEKKGMIIKAKQAFQRALEENPEYMLAVESLERLKYALN